MTHVTYRLTATNRDQLRNPTLGNRVRAAFTEVYKLTSPPPKKTQPAVSQHARSSTETWKTKKRRATNIYGRCRPSVNVERCRLTKSIIASMRGAPQSGGLQLTLTARDLGRRMMRSRFLIPQWTARERADRADFGEL